MGNNKRAKAAVLKLLPGQCYFCRSSVEDEAKFGKMYLKNGVSIHYFCMLFASGLSQRGRSDREGILGFLLPDIKREAQRSARLRCTYCKLPTASIGCVKTNCRTCFHFGCGVENGTLNQYFGNYSSYCYDHRPYQEVPSAELRKYRAKKSNCVICMSAVFATPQPDTIRTPCCKANSWYHKDCLQRMATCSGLHFFKCPLCNNIDIFQKEMLECGIHIPDQDAAWELEPNAFQELLERHNQCDVVDCCCPQGRRHSVKATPWEVVLCNTCGHMGCHLQCARLSSPTASWVCHECRAIIAKTTSTKDIHIARKRGRPKGTTSGCKRKRSIEVTNVGSKKPKLSLNTTTVSPALQTLSPTRTDYGSESSPLSVLQNSSVESKKTEDASKIKRSVGRPRTRDIRDYMFSNSGLLLKTVKHKPNENNLAEQKARHSRSYSAIPCCSTMSCRKEDVATASKARAQRAMQRRSRDDEDRLIPTDDMPNWMKTQIKEDVFTGRTLRLSHEHTGKEPRLVRRHTRSGRFIECSPTKNNKPQWLAGVQNEDCLGSTFSPLSTNLQLAPGIETHLQPSSTGKASASPSGRGKHCSPFPSGHPGSPLSANGATCQTQGASGYEYMNGRKVKRDYTVATSEAKNPFRQLKYWEFVQHLEDIGATPSHASIIERLSLYQQHIEGEYHIVSFADIKSAKLVDENTREVHSPTPSLVSPNDLADDVSMDSLSSTTEDSTITLSNSPSIENIQSYVNNESTYSLNYSAGRSERSVSPSLSMLQPYSPTQSCTDSTKMTVPLPDKGTINMSKQDKESVDFIQPQSPHTMESVQDNHPQMDNNAQSNTAETLPHTADIDLREVESRDEIVESLKPLTNPEHSIEHTDCDNSDMIESIKLVQSPTHAEKNIDMSMHFNDETRQRSVDLTSTHDKTKQDTCYTHDHVELDVPPPQTSNDSDAIALGELPLGTGSKLDQEPSSQKSQRTIHSNDPLKNNDDQSMDSTHKVSLEQTLTPQAIDHTHDIPMDASNNNKLESTSCEPSKNAITQDTNNTIEHSHSTDPIPFNVTDEHQTTQHTIEDTNQKPLNPRDKLQNTHDAKGVPSTDPQSLDIIHELHNIHGTRYTNPKPTDTTDELETTQDLIEDAHSTDPEATDELQNTQGAIEDGCSTDLNTTHMTDEQENAQDPIEDTCSTDLMPKESLPEPKFSESSDKMSDSEDEDCILMRIEDVRTVGPSDPIHIEIEEIATVPGRMPNRTFNKPRSRPVVIKAGEISTIPGQPLITIKEEPDVIMLKPTYSRKCMECGKQRRSKCTNSVQTKCRI